MTDELQQKVDRAVKLIQQAGRDGMEVEVSYSGGKDSDVILELARMSGIKYRAIYKNTTIDPPGTIAHAKENGAEVIRPKHSFFELVSMNGFPNRFARHCCRFLKEYKILDRNIMGVRKAESNKRKARYTEPTECRFYGSKKEHVEAFYPILDWSDQDVVDFIEARGIKVHPLYYREDGTIDPKRRLGCMCCPLAYKPKRIAEFKKYPNMVKAYLRAGQKFRASHPVGKNAQMFPDVYTWFVRDVFYPDVPRKWEDLNSGMFEHPDYKAFLMDYFGIKL
jgi:phosphoadenosine phosphosulfate reductase